MSTVWELDLPAGEKLVLLALADQASDDGTQCWPSVARIAQRCGQAERTVRQALGALEAKHHLTRQYREGSSTYYRVHPCRPHGGGMAAAPAEPGDDLLSGLDRRPPRRASRLPETFVPSTTGKTAALVARWPPERLASELEQFADYHRAKGTFSFDWQASWRSWARKAQTWERLGGTQRQIRFDRPGGARPDPILAALRRAVAEERAERGEADHPRAGAALSAGRG